MRIDRLFPHLSCLSYFGAIVAPQNFYIVHRRSEKVNMYLVCKQTGEFSVGRFFRTIPAKWTAEDEIWRDLDFYFLGLTKH